MNLRWYEKQLAGLGFKTVAGILQLADAAARSDQLPAAYVMPEAESSQGNRLFGSGVHDQQIDVGFAVLIVVPAAPARPDAASDQLQELRDGARDKLMGLVHPEADAPTDYIGGRLLSVGGGAASWLSRFRTSEGVRKEMQ